VTEQAAEKLEMVPACEVVGQQIVLEDNSQAAIESTEVLLDLITESNQSIGRFWDRPMSVLMSVDLPEPFASIAIRISPVLIASNASSSPTVSCFPG
jgi:hypothetical protein